MSGVSYRVDTSELERLADDLVERISRPAPALRAVADLAEQTVQRNFTEGGRPTKWAPLKLREHLEQIERDLLLACLRRNAGNQTLAARELGLPRRTLIYRMGRLNIHFGDPRT